MPRVSGARLLARALRQAEGGDPIFTLSGHQILPIYDAGLDEGLRFFDTRHESAAAHMADAWGRLTTRPGVCLVTAAPGFTNALSGVTTAWMAESPVVFLSGGTAREHVGKGGFQELDQVTMAGPICKQAWSARSAAELPTLVAHAFRTAQEGVPGPVHLTLPSDVLAEVVEEGEVAWPAPADFEPTHRRAPAEEVRRAVGLLAEAQRPVLLGGAAVWRGVAGERLRELLDLTGLPGLPIESPIGLGDPMLHGLGKELSRCDLAILLAPQDFAIGFARPPALGETARLVQVATEKGEIGRSRPVEVGLVGDPGSVLGQLLAAARKRSWPRSGWRAELEAVREAALARHEALERADAVPLHPLRVVAAVRAALRAGDCLALDGGEFARWARWGLAGGPFEFLVNGKLGGLGSGIPFAIAAALARPAARAVAFVGDGTFGFHAMELDTAVRHGVPCVVVVGNDAGWGTERLRQIEQYGPERVVVADLLPTRYDRLAEALGAHGELVERPEELGPAIERALGSQGPACVNVRIASADRP